MLLRLQVCSFAAQPAPLGLLAEGPGASTAETRWFPALAANIAEQAFAPSALASPLAFGTAAIQMHRPTLDYLD